MSHAAAESPASILVADDDEAVRTPLVRHLQDQGHGVLVAGSGPEAYETLRRQKVSVVLLATRIRGSNPIELVPAMLELEPSIAILMLAELNEATTAALCMQRGAMDYITDPQDVELVARAGRPRRFDARSEDFFALHDVTAAASTISIRGLLRRSGAPGHHLPSARDCRPRSPHLRRTVAPAGFAGPGGTGRNRRHRRWQHRGARAMAVAAGRHGTSRRSPRRDARKDDCDRLAVDRKGSRQVRHRIFNGCASRRCAGGRANNRGRASHALRRSTW